MGKRYFLSRVIGTGTKPDPFRLAVVDTFTGSYAAIIPQGSAWGIAIVNSADFTAADADANSAGFPAGAIDTPLSAIPAAVRNKANTFLTNHGVDLSGLTLSNTVADVLDRVKQAFGHDWRSLFA